LCSSYNRVLEDAGAKILHDWWVSKERFTKISFNLIEKLNNNQYPAVDNSFNLIIMIIIIFS
jgi:hypothetical protein